MMKKIFIVTYVLNVFVFICCCIARPVVGAAQDDPQTPLVYDATATAQLKEQSNHAYFIDEHYNRNELYELIGKGADPRVKNANSMTLLHKVAYANDYEFAELVLTRKADPNVLNATQFSPLVFARQVDVAQLLIRYGANMYIPNDHGTVLNSVITLGRPATIVAFLCNEGIDPNITNKEGYCSFHHLFRGNISYQNDQDLQKITAILLWSGVNPNKPAPDKDNLLERVKKIRPDLVPHVTTLMTIVPQIKVKKTQEYYSAIKPLLMPHISADTAHLAIEYAGCNYDESYWPEIESSMKQDLEESTNKSRKRSRSKSP